jgi:hypothetical protein
MAKRKRVTSAELMARLQSDPEWVRRNAEREARHREFTALLARDERPIVDELVAAGHRIQSVWDLVNTSESYPAAIPILIKHFQGNYHPRVIQGIIRALTVKEARPAAGRPILDRLKGTNDPHGSETRWLLANALIKVANASLADELLALYEDPAYDDVHERLRKTLRRLRRKV